MVGLAIVLGNARKKVFELQQQIRHKGNEDEQIVRQAKEEAERILAQARLQGQREADTITLEAQTQLRVVEGKSQEVDARRKAAEVEAREILLKARDAAEKEAQRSSNVDDDARADSLRAVALPALFRIHANLSELVKQLNILGDDHHVRAEGELKASPDRVPLNCRHGDGVEFSPAGECALIGGDGVTEVLR